MLTILLKLSWVLQLLQKLDFENLLVQSSAKEKLRTKNH